MAILNTNFAKTGKYKQNQFKIQICVRVLIKNAINLNSIVKFQFENTNLQPNNQPPGVFRPLRLGAEPLKPRNESQRGFEEREPEWDECRGFRGGNGKGEHARRILLGEERAQEYSTRIQLCTQQYSDNIRQYSLDMPKNEAWTGKYWMILDEYWYGQRKYWE